MRARALFAVVAVAATMLLAGCTSLTAAIQPDTKVVSREGTVAVPKAKVRGELPAGLPASLPLWPGATVASAEVDDEGTIDVALDVTDSFADVVAGVGVGFERAGWKVVEGLTDETTTVLEVANDGYDGVVTITNGEDVGTSIEYLLSPFNE